MITVLAFSFIAVVILLTSWLQNRKDAQNLFVNFETEQDTGQDTLRKIIDVLRARTRSVDLRRVDTKNDSLHASFLISVPEPLALEQIISELKTVRPDASVTFVEQTRQFDI
jgi:uncharacterized membrane protein YhiD involved in acid resistance